MSCWCCNRRDAGKGIDKKMLKRKVRKVGKSLVVTIPADIVRSLDIKNGDELEIIPDGFGELTIKKV